MILCDNHDILKLAADAVELEITLNQAWGTADARVISGAEGELYLNCDDAIELFFEDLAIDALVSDSGMTLRDHFENGDPIGVVTTQTYWRESLEGLGQD